MYVNFTFPYRFSFIQVVLVHKGLARSYFTFPSSSLYQMNSDSNRWDASNLFLNARVAVEHAYAVL